VVVVDTVVVEVVSVVVVVVLSVIVVVVDVDVVVVVVDVVVVVVVDVTSWLLVKDETVVSLETTSSTSMVFSWRGLRVNLFLMLLMMVQDCMGAGDVSHFSIHSNGSSGITVS